MEKKISTLTKNYSALKNVNVVSWMGLILHGCALKYTVKGKLIEHKKVNKGLKLIRENTSIFSDFRGNSSVSTAIVLSFQQNPKISLEHIIDIHKKLRKKKFYSSDSLALTAITIFENKEKINIDECIDKVKIIHEFIRQSNSSLTAIDDYRIACEIAINSKDISKSLIDMQNSYEYLVENGFNKNSTIQSLAYILAQSNKRRIWDSCTNIKKELDRNKFKLHEYGYPLIGVIALLETDDIKSIINESKNTSKKLKEYKGYGDFVLVDKYRNMVAIIIVISKYIEGIDKSNYIVTDIIDNIDYIMDMAVNVATTNTIVVNNCPS